MCKYVWTEKCPFSKNPLENIQKVALNNMISRANSQDKLY